MKILHIIIALESGGAENLLVDIINEQVKDSQIGLLIINDCVNPSIYSRIDSRVSVFFMNRKVGSFSPVLFLKMNLQIIHFDPDLIHSHSDDIIKALFPTLRRKTVLTVHDTLMYEQCLKKYKALFAISKSVQRIILEKTNLSAILNYNGVKVSEIRKRKTSVNLDDFRIVQISRLVHEKKGQDLILKAIKLLKDKGCNVRLDLIGSGPSETYLNQLICEYNLESQIRILGERTREYIYENLCEYDLLVQPSRYEGFGLTVAEAMAAEVPVLVANLDGPSEIVEQGKFGTVFEVSNAIDLTNKIEYIIQNYDSILIKTKKASLYVKESFDITKTASRYLDYYPKLKV